MNPDQGVVLTMMSLTGPEGELDNFRARMESPAGASLCNLWPMPSELGAQMFGLASSDPNGKTWDQWQRENWGPVGGDYALVMVSSRPFDDGTSMVRFMFRTFQVGFNAAFYSAVSLVAPSATFVAVTRDVETSVSSWITVRGGFILSQAADIRPDTSPSEQHCHRFPFNSDLSD